VGGCGIKLLVLQYLLLVEPIRCGVVFNIILELEEQSLIEEGTVDRWLSLAVLGLTFVLCLSVCECNIYFFNNSIQLLASSIVGH